MLKLPFFSELEQAERVLLAGAGGGYDIFSGLPLYFALLEAGKQVFLANLSFSHLPSDANQQIAPSVVTVTADSWGSAQYFPERGLARWFREQGEEVPIYCFKHVGFGPLLAGYQALVEHLAVDTVILVDGGTDSLMRGDEYDLGTPEEDITSIAAVDALEVERKLLVCLGFGVDSHERKVCHAQFLEAVAELTQKGGFLGTFSLMEEMPEAQRFRQATESVFTPLLQNESIVCSSILSALVGHYGDHHATPRTAGSTLWINPLMTLYWCFRLEPLARRILYLEEIKQTESIEDVRRVIAEFRRRCSTIRPWQAIPV
jgi:hypothetical protein